MFFFFFLNGSYVMPGLIGQESRSWFICASLCPMYLRGEWSVKASVICLWELLPKKCPV